MTTVAHEAAIAAVLPRAQRDALRALDALHPATAKELGVSASALALLSCHSPPLVARRWNAVFSCYEYRCTPLGVGVRERLLGETP